MSWCLRFPFPAFRLPSSGIRPPFSVLRPRASVLRPPALPSAFPPFRFSLFQLFLRLLLFSASALHAGLSFDTGASPEEARDLLAGESMAAAPADSWLRLRDMERSAVRSREGAEISLWPGANPAHPIDIRRQALQRLRARGFHLVAMLRWPSDSWAGGVRTDNPIRRLAYDLREPFERTRALAATYGDLIDYWEIENEPDISFVEENPETYAAFLKACYLGIAAGRRENLKEGETEKLQGGGSDDPRAEPSSSSAPTPPPTAPLATATVTVTATRHSARSAVLMAPLALPPGPYLTALMANHGLQYTDGFNYHYYGYAEDFTGVYEQFKDAVERVDPNASAPSQAANNEQRIRVNAFHLDSTFVTHFYPNTTGWQAAEVARFDHAAEAASANRALLESRPLADGEPALVPDGRWLVSPGVTVEETAEGWRFHIASWAPGPLRPAMAELPLPEGWKPGGHALLGFDYRIVADGSRPPAAGETRNPAGQVVDLAPGQPPQPRQDTGNRPPLAVQPLQIPNSSPSPRSLPVFLTEYGYGLLDKTARDTAEGRARQEAWFERVLPQIHALGIDGAMAFLLKPYLEANRNEFGLLMERVPEGEKLETEKLKTETGHPAADLQAFSFQPFRLSGFHPSPALQALVTDSLRPIAPQTWTVTGPAAPTAVVLDFVAGAGLVQAKSYDGYLLRGDYGRATQAAEGRIVAYNLGSATTSGELHLEGDAWTLTDGNRTLALTLNPGERREVPVRIMPSTRRFEPQPARARFVPSETPASGARPPPRNADVAAEALAKENASEKLPIAASAPLHAQFETYLRTKNGNLYQTWPRPTATEAWQRYAERLGNFTMAFFGRAHLPWPFAENDPAALVFFFRPEQLPLTFEIRRARVTELSAP